MAYAFPGWSDGSRLGRRAALRSAALAGAALAAGGALAGCGPGGAASGSSKAAAAPTPAAAARTVLVLRPWYNFPSGTSNTAVELYTQALQPFLQKHPGVDVKITTIGYQQATVAAILAGVGPDVFEDWVLPLYTTGNLIANLSSFIKRDNVNLGVYPPGQTVFFQEAGGFASAGPGIYCLPAYLHTVAIAVNLGVLDQLGLGYPQPGWTHLDWTRLWEATTLHKSGKATTKPRAGAAFYWAGYQSSGANPAPFYWRGFGGEFVDAANPSHCWLDSPGSIACAEWAYPLLRQGVITTGGDLASGTVVCQPRGSAGGLPYSARAWNGLKWDLFAQPVFPVHKTTYAATDFYAINAATKHPDLSWELLKFLCVDTHWQRFMMKLALTGPNQRGLWEEWAAIVQGVAPPLRHKNLGVIGQAVLNNEPYCGLVFHYASQQSAAVIKKYSLLAQQGQMPVAEAFRLAATQVDAVQKAGNVESTAGATVAKAFPTVGSPIAAVLPGL